MAGCLSVTGTCRGSGARLRVDTGRWEYWKMMREKRSWESSSVRRPVTEVCEGSGESQKSEAARETTDRTEDSDGRLARRERAGAGRKPNLLALHGRQLEANLVHAYVLLAWRVSTANGTRSWQRTQGRMLRTSTVAVTPSSSTGRPPLPSFKRMRKVGKATAAKSAHQYPVSCLRVVDEQAYAPLLSVADSW